MGLKVRRFGFVTILLACGTLEARAGELARRVEDINTEVALSSGWICSRKEAPNYVTTGPTGFFSASDGTDGCELWVTEGAPLDGQEVRSLTLGFASSSPELLAAAGGLAYFLAQTPEVGLSLWRSDGSFDGTVLLLDLEDEMHPWPTERVAWMEPIGTSVLFAVRTDSVRVALWRTDGTPEGTERVVELGDDHTNEVRFRSVVSAGSSVYFLLDRTIWRSDGSSTGTVPVVDWRATGAPPLDPTDLLTFKDRVYFAGRASSYQRGLWRTASGDVGAELVWRPPATAELRFWTAAVAGSRILFEVIDAGESQLWATDGSSAGPDFLRTFELDGDQLGIRELTRVGTRAFFFAAAAGFGREPWISDGTPSGTLLLRDIRPGAGGSFVDGDPLRSHIGSTGGRALMRADDGVHGIEPWISDGTPAGTRMLLDLWPGQAGSGPELLGPLAGGWTFAAATEAAGVDLFVADGAAGSLERLSALGTRLSSSDPRGLFDHHGLLLFSALEHSQAQAWPWRSDGTESGTYPLGGDLGGWPPGTFVASLENGRAVAYIEYPDEPSVLWSTDGETIEPVGEFGYACHTRTCGIGTGVHDAGAAAVFTWRTPIGGWELWSTDGTAEGTAQLLDIRPGLDSSSPLGFTSFFGRQLFFPFEDAYGREPWLTRGTVGSTYRLVDLVTGPLDLRTWEVWPASAVPPAFYVREVLSKNGLEERLWYFDGDATLVLVKGGLGYGTVRPLGFYRGRLLFEAQERDDPGIGAELWVSDGTPAGTGLIRDIWPGPRSSKIVGGSALAAGVVFGACDPDAGCELWATDGTTAGTRRVSDLEPGWQSSLPTGMRAIGDRVYFASCTTEFGCEPWETDGTAPGTRQLADLAAGSNSSLAEPWSRSFEELEETFVPSGLSIYFSASDGSGWELWAIDVSLFAEGYESGDLSRWNVTFP